MLGAWLRPRGIRSCGACRARGGTGGGSREFEARDFGADLETQSHGLSRP